VSKPKVETLDLYTVKDVARVRALLIQEQKGISALSNLPLYAPCLDHVHDSEQLVRAVINNNENIALGRIESLYARYVGYWYKGSYPEFLRLTADYIERGTDVRFRHPGWVKKVNTEFNKLSEGKKDVVLRGMGALTGSNSTERKKYFNACVMSRKFDYNTIARLINSAK
jgi:hypothetical protein